MKTILIVLTAFMSTLIYAQPGERDSSFGNNGRVITNFQDYNAELNSIAIQPDGKIIVAGTGENDTNEDILAVRYLPNGELDLSFGINGTFSLSINDKGDRCDDIAIDSVGNIFLTGSTFTENFETKGFVIKLDNNGILYSKFAQNGIWISTSSSLNESMKQILFPSNGNIVVTGNSVSFDYPTRCIAISLKSDGSLDPNFGVNGYAHTDVPDGYNPRFASLNSKEEIISGGFQLNQTTDILLFKYNQEGIIDSTFGINGTMLDDTNIDNFAYNIAILDDDKILIAHAGDNGNGRDFNMVKYNQDGTLDLNFGVNGRVSTDFSQASNTSHTISIQDDGKIILGGFTGITPNHNYAIARYDSLGNLDTTFGDNGKVITNFGTDDLIFAASIQPDGKLVCAGNSKTTGGLSSFSLARYFTQIKLSTSTAFDLSLDVKTIPNPSEGDFTLSFELDHSSIVYIKIYNAAGYLVYQMNENMSVGVKNIDYKLRSKLETGIYLVKVETEEGYTFNKMIVE